MTNAVITFPLLGENFKLSFSSSFELFGWRFYWYGLIIAVGFVLAVLYMLRRSKSFGLTQDNIIDVMICAIPSAIVGARLYYVIFNPAEYVANPIDIIKVWEGGLAIYGGVIAGIIAIAVYSKVKKLPLGALLDISALGVLIGQIIGRWGNFVNREAYGARTDVPWKMGLTNQYGTFYYHPTFLYESLWNLVGFVLLHFYSKSKHRKYDGQMFLMYVGWYGLGRYFIEGLRTDSLYLFSTNIRVSQLLAGLSFLAAAILLFYNWVMRPHDPEKLWVNRVARGDKVYVSARKLRAAAKAEEAARAAEAEEDEDDWMRDDTPVYTTHRDEEADDAPLGDGPVVEPIDVKLFDEQESTDAPDESGKDE